MDDGLAIRKIIVDSRTSTVGHGSSLELQLPQTVNIPNGFGVYVTDVCVTHSWRTVHGNSSIGGKNHYLYFMERMWYHGGPEDFQ